MARCGFHVVGKSWILRLVLRRRPDFSDCPRRVTTEGSPRQGCRNTEPGNICSPVGTTLTLTGDKQQPAVRTNWGSATSGFSRQSDEPAQDHVRKPGTITTGPEYPLSSCSADACGIGGGIGHMAPMPTRV